MKSEGARSQLRARCCLGWGGIRIPTEESLSVTPAITPLDCAAWPRTRDSHSHSGRLSHPDDADIKTTRTLCVSQLSAAARAQRFAIAL